MSFKPGRVTTYVKAVHWLGSWLSSFSRSPMTSFDSRECGDKSEGLLLAQFGGRGWLVIYTIILKAVSGLSYEQHLDHLRPSSYSRVQRNGPIKVYWQLCL